MDRADFDRALAALSDRKTAGIGTLGEKSVHAVLKLAYEPHPENQEITVGGFVADIVGEEGIIEIQSGSFGRLRQKLEAFLPVCDVTVVYPIAMVEWICRVDPSTGELTRRRSPKKKTPYLFFQEAYPLRELIADPRLHIRIVLLEVDRYERGTSSRDRVKLDRVPTGFFEEIRLDAPADYGQFIPAALEGPFSVADFAREAKLSEELSRYTVNLLLRLGLLKSGGKKGRKNLFLRTEGEKGEN